MSNETSRVDAAAWELYKSANPDHAAPNLSRVGGPIRVIYLNAATSALAAADADDLANGIRRVRADEEARFARIKVVDGSLTSFPVVGRVYGGWQSGVMFYPDSLVEKVTPLHLIPAPEGVHDDSSRNVR